MADNLWKMAYMKEFMIVNNLNTKLDMVEMPVEI
jgi:hypothetical protein